MILIFILFFVQDRISTEAKLHDDVSNIAQFLQNIPTADRPVVIHPKANGNFLQNNYEYVNKIYKTASVTPQAALNPLKVLTIDEGEIYKKTFDSPSKDIEDNGLQNIKTAIHSLNRSKFNTKSILNWLESFFKVTTNPSSSIEEEIVTTDSTTQATTFPTINSDTTTEYNNDPRPESKGLISVYDLGVAIERLYDVLNTINQNIVTQNQQLANITDRIYVFRLPNSDETKRAKRSVTYESSQVTRENETGAQTKDVTCNITRRFSESEPNSLSEVRLKLLEYIEEGFQDIQQKINGLKPVKDLYLKDNVFMIGYIMANIDTLDNNVKNLKIDMYNSKEQWDDKKILEIFDSSKVSGKVLSNLMESLSTYVGKAQNNT